MYRTLGSTHTLSTADWLRRRVDFNSQDRACICLGKQHSCPEALVRDGSLARGPTLEREWLRLSPIARNSSAWPNTDGESVTTYK